MLKIIKAALFLILLIQLPAYATGFGDIQIQSRLGEPLDLRLQVFGVDDVSDDNLRFTIADKSIYKAMGVEFNFSHNTLKMKIERNVDNQVSVRIRSPKPIHEPFINFIVQLKSPKGIHIKEVTTLLELPKPL